MNYNWGCPDMIINSGGGTDANVFTKKMSDECDIHCVEHGIMNQRYEWANFDTNMNDIKHADKVLFFFLKKNYKRGRLLEQAEKFNKEFLIEWYD